MCLLLVWRVCDQAFGKYWPLNGGKKWSHDITKIEKLCMLYSSSVGSVVYNLSGMLTRRKFTDSKNAILSVYNENN